MLISSPNCGWVNTNLDTNTTDEQTVLYPYWSQEVQDAASYAQNCYASDDSSSALQCGTFVRKRLPSSVDTNASCPFASPICKNNVGNMLLDTGYLDSHDDLGLNAPLDQRFQYRRTLHCAPITTQGYTMTWNKSSDQSYTRYYYGDAVAGFNWTYFYSNDAFQGLGPANGGVTAFSDYSLGYAFSPFIVQQSIAHSALIP